MAENGVVKEPLTKAMIHAGAELTKKLDELQWPVHASLWLYESEGNQWKLLLASPRVTADGPKRSYEVIQTALAAIPNSKGAIALSDIGVTDPDNPLIALLGMSIGTSPTVRGIRFKRNAINGHFIEDAYIYRVAAKAPIPKAV